MRYYYDSEFIDTGSTIDLISIGIVAEDGRELYAQVDDFIAGDASDWVKENVFPYLLVCPSDENEQAGWTREGLTFSPNEFHLGVGKCKESTCPWRKREQIKAEILAFMDIEKYGYPELIGYYSAYDHVVFCQIFGTMMDLPEGFPMLTYDLRQWLDMNGMKDVRQPDDSVHNALLDARWIAETYKRLRSIASW